MTLSKFYCNIAKTIKLTYMKKMFTILSVLGLSIASYAQVTVTYQVDINAYIAAGNTLNANGMRVGGNFTSNGSTVADWSPSDASAAMTDLGNGIWSIDVTYPTASVGATQFYKFVNGDWGTNEGTDAANTIVSGGCGVDDGSGNINRTLTIPSSNTTLCFVWDACTACTASLPEAAINNVVVTPNPVNETATFTFALNGSNDVTITLFDLAGKVVSTTTVSNQTTAAVNTSMLNAGTYIYTVKAGESTVTGKIVK
jgi:hypothetical protein